MTPHINCERWLNDWLHGFYLNLSPFATAKFRLYRLPRPFGQALGHAETTPGVRTGSSDNPLALTRWQCRCRETNPIRGPGSKGRPPPLIFSYVWQIKDFKS